MKLPSWPEFLGERNIDLGLHRVEELLKRLGNPERKLPPIIHVAGTNGKGSTIAFMKAMYEAAGYKVHRYTSPHLLEFNERIMLAGAPISDGYLNDIIDRCKQAADELPITFFEGVTAIALLAFAEMEADVVLLEVGLGGRLDATNVVSPAATVITPIGLDHTDYLGDTIEQIAGEKAGIIKPDVPCIIAKQSRSGALPVLQARAEVLGAPVTVVADDSVVDVSQRKLLGSHQADNARTAVATVEQLQHILPVSHEQMQAGVRSAIWPARMQQLTAGALVDALPAGVELWIDGGHNEDAVPAIIEQVHVWQAAGKRVLPVVAMRDNKDGALLMQSLSNACETVCVMAIPDTDFSAEPGMLANTIPNATIIQHLSDLFERADNNTILFACGSLYFAASVLAENNKG